MALSSGASQAAPAAAFSSNETSDWSGIATIPNMTANHLDSGSGDHLAVRQGRSLEYFTLGWNAMEAVVAVAAGVFAQSTSLVGFGIDSCIESLSGTVLLVGLGANALFGWWWADPVAALAMVPIIGKEGIGALRGDTCSCKGSCATDR